ncbi:phosphotransferase family protein [Ammoniphilus resinae]|uniref:Aminoglycoside phosphotransferase (APT) family kinase protein n=1 Tax=Ammoniphilus resinae TaxID=861532 RepID=A0ABS4GM34_9BACL|nr:phosphotransferase family protein [Ammoniphilus resinae]MBP1931132.1 aminoglycoside phosphotransferase (APT) family kinase protein [Ammoniphilus resinae]
MGHEEPVSIHAGNGINWEMVERFLRFHINGLSNDPLQVHPFSAGYSNLTYKVQIGSWEAVLRRPPFGQVPPKAHDMEREYRILKKLHPVYPLAPQPYLYGDDPQVMEKHFYIMEIKKGLVLDDTLPPQFNQPETCRVISEAVVDTLVMLHDVDIQKARLEEIGRPAGFLERQVNGWIKRYQAAKSEELSGVEMIEKWLVDNIPTSPPATMIHNDFKLNNMMLSPHDPSKVVAVFDWEMCTVGDPLMDLGVALAYWTETGEAETGLTSITKNPGFISRREFIELYAQKSRRDLIHIDYYLTFAFYKVAAVLQQIYARWRRGEIHDERFAKLGVGVQNLMEQSYKAMKKELV